jgi:hypothetical protein
MELALSLCEVLGCHCDTRLDGLLASSCVLQHDTHLWLVSDVQIEATRLTSLCPWLTETMPAAISSAIRPHAKFSGGVAGQE